MSCRSKLLDSMLGLSGIFMCGVAFAADSSAPAYDFGGMTAYPGLGVVVKNDSNIFRSAEGSPAKRSSVITVISPSVLLQAQKAANTYSLAYGLDIGRYSSSSADNYLDQNLLGQAVLGLTSRSTFKFSPQYQIGHDDRGATFGAATAEPNTWRAAGVVTSFDYGAAEARAHAMLEADYTDRQYKNNRVVTTAYDKTMTGFGGTFYYRVQPKTSLLLHARRTNIDYDQVGSLLNGDERRYMIGVKWEATAQSTGEFKIGQLKKSFDSTYASYSGTSWEGALRWSPVSYVKADLNSYRKTSESTLNGASTILLRNTGLNVAYDLNDRVTLSANGNRLNEDFVGAARADRTNTAGLKAEYHFRSWLIGGAEYSNSKKTSSDPANDYKRNIFMLSVRSVL